MSTRKTILCRLLLAVVLFALPASLLRAQSKLSIDKVYAVYLRNSGTIVQQGQIKGYFFLYQSDKIDRHTNEYNLQILDENLNKVKSIQFEDSKKLSLMEAAYNGSSLSFLFKNEDTKTLDMKIYDFDGKLKYAYSRDYDKKTDELMKQYETLHTDEGMNKNVFDVGDQGYVSVLPLRDGKQRTYQVDFYSSQTKKQWTYEPTDDAEKYAFAEYLGCTDSLIILEVMKRNRALSTNITAHFVGINFVTKKKQFELEQSDKDAYKILPSSVSPIEGSSNLLVIGSYYDRDENVMKDYGKGLAFYEITPAGKVISKTYNSWDGEFAKYLTTNSKGKIDEVGYLYIHRVIRTPDHKLFLVGEGYKREANAAGIALTVLSMGRTNAFGVTKVVITDMVMMQFDEKYKVKGATIFDKRNNTAMTGAPADQNSQHYIAKFLKASGAFDYEFTTGDADNSNFAVCYSDYERSSEYHGQTFNAIRYNGTKFSTDKIELKTKASRQRVFPAKAGSVMIMEYFKKEKRLDFRLEKLG
jgi:hypothetical protein